MQIVFNPISGTFDLVGMTQAQANAYLKLDQTIIQHVINNPPQFDEGITIKRDKRVYLDGI